MRPELWGWASGGERGRREALANETMAIRSFGSGSVCAKISGLREVPSRDARARTGCLWFLHLCSVVEGTPCMHIWALRLVEKEEKRVEQRELS